MNPLWLILLVGGGALYFSKLNNTGEQLSITILNLSGLKFGSGALQFSVNIAIDNPTNTSITIKQPNIKAFYNGNEVGNTIPSGKRISIKANDRTPIDPINLQIPFSNLPSVVMSLFTRTGTDKLAFDIEVSTEVNGIPISKRKTLSI
jgi:LEA14-like dessication related protein